MERTNRWGAGAKPDSTARKRRDLGGNRLTWMPIRQRFALGRGFRLSVFEALETATFSWTQNRSEFAIVHAFDIFKKKNAPDPNDR